MTKKQEKRFRYACTMPGFDDFWIEINTSTWGLYEIMDIPYAGHINLIRKYLPLYATDWHVKGEDGAVIPLPKSQEYDVTWELAFKRLGAGGRVLWEWFGNAVVAALNEVIMPPKSGANSDS